MLRPIMVSRYINVNLPAYIQACAIGAANKKAVKAG